MANYTTLERPQWGGANATLDDHVALYDAQVETGFNHQAIFVQLAVQRSVSGKSNSIRIDRMAGAEVKRRKVNEEVVETRSPTQKITVVVECMTYVRNVIDWLDDWMSPDYWSELGQNAATAFALDYDQSHIILLQKAPEWVAPDHLKKGGAFNDGIHSDVTLAAKATTEAVMQANAQALVNAHGDLINVLVKRRVPLADMITIVTPDVYTELLHHDKLINKDYVDSNGDFAGRRVVKLNGIPVVECVSFPEAGVAITGHDLSTDVNDHAFDITAAQAKGEMIIFSKSRSLVTVTAKEWTKNAYAVDEKMADHLDHFAVWTASCRRPDTVAVVRVTRA